MADFASMLKFLRKRENLSQRELASKLGMSPSAIGMYESGKRRPKHEDEEAIADFFNVDLNTLRGIRINENDPVYEYLLTLYKERIEIKDLIDLFLNAIPEAKTSAILVLKAGQIEDTQKRDIG